MTRDQAAQEYKKLSQRAYKTRDDKTRTDCEKKMRVLRGLFPGLLRDIYEPENGYSSRPSWSF